MQASKTPSLFLLLALVAVLGACAKKPVMETAPAVVADPAAAVSPAAPAEAGATLTTLAGAQLQPVYFDFDSFTLSPAAQQSLAANAELLRQEPTLKITIEGHCDERGSDEYNLALGSQRGDAVKNYLVTLGIAADRLHAISYGEERPAVPDSNEAAWAKNRRAAFN